MEKKKIMSLFALGCGALLITGCGTDTDKEDKEKDNDKVSATQTLECSYSEKEDETTAEMGFTFVYDNKEEKLTEGQMLMSYTYDFSELTDSEKKEADDMMETMLGGMCDSFNDQEGYKDCKTNYKNGKFDMIVEFDIENLTSATEGDLKSDMTLKELKDYFENESTEKMTCTIK